MSNILATVAQSSLGQVIGTSIRSGGDVLLGLGALGMLHKMSGVSLAAISWMQAQGVKSNEKKEAVAEDKQLSKSLEDRAIKLITQDGTDLLKTAAVIGGGITLIYLGSHLGGDSLAEGLVAGIGLVPDHTKFIALQFATSTMMSAGNTVMGMGVIKALQAIFSVNLAGQSAVMAEGVKANEEKEGKGEEVGKGLSERAMRFISNDLLDIPKALAVSAAGMGVMLVGAYFGGQSIQSSVSKLIGC